MLDKPGALFEALRGHSLQTKLAALTSTSLAGASWAMVDVVLRDAAAIGSLCVSIVALWPVVRKWWHQRRSR